MIQSFVYVPTTEQSHPFCSAVHRCRLAEHGYREDEYLFRGTSNVYRSGPDNLPECAAADVPYTNRLIVRKPEDMSRFSGAVVVEIINSTANFDIERVWAESWRYLVRCGIVYVGFTSKPNVLPQLKRFDPERYGSLDWPNPLPDPNPAPEIPTSPISLGAPDQELGLVWDMMRELPAVLRSGAPGTPLAGTPAKYIYLSGWSQSCSYINRLVNSFVLPAGQAGAALYDGYFAAGGIHTHLTPLNRSEHTRAFSPMEARLDHCPVPLIEINTESENSDDGTFGGYAARRPDSDLPGFRYRYLDLAGGSHDSQDTGRDYLYFDDDGARALGHELHGYDLVPILNDYPKCFAFHMALHSLRVWAEQGVPPVRQPRIPRNGAGSCRKDAFGNSLGGLRTPALDLPVGRYFSNSVYPDASGKPCVDPVKGHMEPFSPALLKELYGDIDHYRALAEQSADAAVAQGMILPEDRSAAVEAAVERAVRFGL